MAIGYNTKQIQGAVDVANVINEYLKSLILPENFKIGATVNVPLVIGSHHIATLTIFTPTAQGEVIEPQIAFNS